MRERLGLVGLGAVGIPGLGLCRRHVEQAACSGDVVGARAAGEQAVVMDAVEALRQDVDQEATDAMSELSPLCAPKQPSGQINTAACRLA